MHQRVQPIGQWIFELLNDGVGCLPITLFKQFDCFAMRAHGMMVNYLYDLEQIEYNMEAYARAGVLSASTQVRNLLLGAK